MKTPFSQSFWFHKNLLCAGQYPGGLLPAERDEKLRGLLDCGIRRVLSLMETNEKSRGGRPFDPYVPRLQEMAGGHGISVECLGLAIRDASAPSTELMRQILDTLDESLAKKLPTYLHCWGGHGRTSTVVACHLIRHGKSPEVAIEQIRQWRTELPKSHFPFEGGQERFVVAWSEDKRG